MTSLSVVVASSPAGTADACGGALEAELAPGDEVVWVGGGPPPRWAGVVVRSGAAGRGTLYREGFDAATHRFVAFTDTTTVVLPGWRRSAVAELDAGAAAVGGPVLPAGASNRRTFAGFAVEYGVHAAPPYRSAAGDVAANNVAYDRGALAAVLEPGEPVWKSVVDARLAAADRPPVLAPCMRVSSVKRYVMRDLASNRARHGRLYGAQQAQRWSVPGRAFRAAGCVALPLVAYGRLAARLRVDAALRRAFVASSPLIFVALVSWSAGEAVGLCTGTGSSDDVF